MSIKDLDKGAFKPMDSELETLDEDGQEKLEGKFRAANVRKSQHEAGEQDKADRSEYESALKSESNRLESLGKVGDLSDFKTDELKKLQSEMEFGINRLDGINRQILTDDEGEQLSILTQKLKEKLEDIMNTTDNAIDIAA